jgi:hypothetical protein
LGLAAGGAEGGGEFEWFHMNTYLNIDIITFRSWRFPRKFFCIYSANRKDAKFAKENLVIKNKKEIFVMGF